MGRCKPGWKKRKENCWFKPNNTHWLASKTTQQYQSQADTSTTNTTTPVKRLTCQELQRAFKHSDEGFLPRGNGVLDSSKCSSPGMLLRPLVDELSHVETSLKERKETEEVSGYIDVHFATCVDAIQDMIVEHKTQYPKCHGRLVSAANLLTKWGVSAIAQLMCNKCNFISSKKKLYREVPHTGRGRKCAEPNRSLALGLMNTSIGAAGAQRLMGSMNKTLPAPSALQKQLNHVGDTIRSLNENDMGHQRKILKDTLEHAGYARDTPVPVECDRQYNLNLRYSRRHTPFAPATQSRDVMVENLTADKKVIAFNHENKLCKSGQLARAKGLKVNCPGHSGCTATLRASENIGDEKKGGQKLAEQVLKKETIFIDKVTTDADGRMSNGVASKMIDATGNDTDKFLDTVHLNRSIATSVSKAKIGLNLKTKIKCTAKQLSQAKNRLGDSLAHRAESEINAAKRKMSDYNEISNAMQLVIPTIIECYKGRHTLCKKYSFVCDGNKPHYEYMPKYAQGTWQFTQHDSQMLQKILHKRLGVDALSKTRYGFTTQKAESVNHVFAITNPKHSMSCSRNGINRDHSAIHLLNNNHGDSILLKARACGVPIQSNSPCLKNLLQLNKQHVYWKRRSRSTVVRNRRVTLRRIRFAMYDDCRNETFYLKGQLDPK